MPFVGVASSTQDACAYVPPIGGGGTPLNPTPVLTSLSENAVTLPGGNRVVSANGSGFVSGMVMQVDGVDVATTYLTAATAQFTIPSARTASAGTLAITAVNPGPGGGASNALSYTVNRAAPTLASVTPASGTAPTGDRALALVGTGFDAGSQVYADATLLSSTFNSATSLSATLPAAIADVQGTKNITVVNPAPGGGTSVARTYISNYATPTIASLTPSVADIDSVDTAVAVVGTGFVPGQTTFRLDGALITGSASSATAASITVPSSALASAGAKSVTATNPAPGGGPSAGATFTVNYKQPTLTSITPNTITAGAADTPIALVGTNFKPVTVGRRNGVALTTTYNSPTSLTATVLAADLASPGTSAITAFTPAPGGGSSPGSQTLTVAPAPPATTGLTAPSGERWFAPRSNTIIGSNFAGNATVTFGATSGIVPTSNSPTALTFTIPDAELDFVGTKSVSVTNPTTGLSSNAQSYAVNQPASLKSWLIADPGNIVFGTGLKVSQWTNEILDDGVKKHATQATSATQPTYTTTDAAYNNKGTIVSASTQLLRSLEWTALLNQPTTVAFYGDQPTASAVYFCDGLAIGTPIGRQGLGSIGGTGRISINAGTVLGEVVNNTTPKNAYFGHFNGASSAVFRGNSATAVATGNAGTQPLRGQTIFANGGGGGSGVTKVRAIGIFDKLLSNTERAQWVAAMVRDSGA